MTLGVMHTSRLISHALGVLLPFTLLVAEDRSLECEVLKADGSPSANASVFYYRPPSVNGISTQPVFAVGQTDQEGRFLAALSQPEPVKVLHGMVLALSADGEVGWLPFSGNAPNQGPAITTQITMGPGGDFRARLLQPDGQPAAGVEVWVGLRHATQFGGPFSELHRNGEAPRSSLEGHDGCGGAMRDQAGAAGRLDLSRAC